MYPAPRNIGVLAVFAVIAFLAVSVATQRSGLAEDRTRPAPRVKQISKAERQYERDRAALKDDDLRGRCALAKRLVSRKRYLLAQRELSDLARRFPKDAEVGKLSEIVARRLKLRAGTDAGDQDGTKPDKGRKQRLTTEQINIIKIYEIDLNRHGQRARVIVPRKVVNEFIEMYADKDDRLRGRKNQATFKRASSKAQLAMMFELKARDLYPKVRIHGDPKVLSTFRRDIHRQYVLNYCGTTRCHGTPGREGFSLFAHRATQDATIYSNFYLLHKYREGEGYMIDRDRPEASYLFQYGLPRVDAATPHPDVPGWQPKFPKKNMALQVKLIDWIDQLYRDPVPEYPIKAAAPDKPDQNRRPDGKTTPKRIRPKARPATSAPKS